MDLSIYNRDYFFFEMNITARFWILCLLGIATSYHKFARAIENTYHDKDGALHRLLEEEEEYSTDLEQRMQAAAKTLDHT